MTKAHLFSTRTPNGLGNEPLFVNDIFLNGPLGSGDGAVNLGALLVQEVRDVALLVEGRNRKKNLLHVVPSGCPKIGDYPMAP